MTIDWKAVKEHVLGHRYVYGLLLLTSLLNFPVWYELVRDWAFDDNYSHGFLVVPIAIYILCRRRTELKWPAKASRLGLALVLIGSAGLILGIAASEFFVTRTSLILQITGIALAYLGKENFRKVWFAFFFLLFMVPLPAVIYYQATLPMQLLSSQATTFLLQVIGVPAVRQGNIINLPGYSLEVIEACSGLRSLVTLLALGSLYSWHYMTSNWRAVALTLAMIPIAMAANVFRIFVTAVGAYAISPELAETFLHEVSGLLVFLSAMVMLLILGAVFKWTEKRFS
ncbi:MAG: exosortase/archaeosortase family protein [candidate division Zixibacteria bacterium]|nr:exosortase/archaeosortase family protein [candidate division Zixibacteria bacterium]